jgi:hypothetical protein
MQDAMDLEEQGIDRKQVKLDNKMQKIIEEGKLAQDKEKSKKNMKKKVQQTMAKNLKTTRFED